MATLPAHDRADLACFLLESLGDDDSDATWDVQLQQRIDDVQQGRVTGVSASEVFDQFRKRFP